MSIIEGLIGPIAKLIDKIIPDPEARDRAKLELIKLEGSQEMEAIRTRMTAIVAEANSADPWTSRARPSFLYVMYALLLWAIPMGLIAAELFDTGVNMGTGIAAGFLQRALNALNRAARDYPDIAVDREIGPRTLSALDGFLKARGKGGETVLLRAMEALQGERYIALAERRPSQEAFLYGWLANRVGES